MKEGKEKKGCICIHPSYIENFVLSLEGLMLSFLFIYSFIGMLQELILYLKVEI